MMRFLLIIVISILSIPASAETPLIDLKISSHTLSVEVSYTKASRERGLMYRKSMKKIMECSLFSRSWLSQYLDAQY